MLNKSGDKARGVRQTLNGFNRRTVLGNRRCKCYSEYHLAPKCPWRDVPRSDICPSSSENNKAPQRPHSTAPMEPIRLSSEGEKSQEGGGHAVKVRSPSRPPWMWKGCSHLRNQTASSCLTRALRPLWFASVGWGAKTAFYRRRNFQGFRRIRNLRGFRFDNGRLGDVRRATDIPVGNAGDKGKIAASAL